MSPDGRWIGVDDVTTHFGVGKDSIYRRVESRSLPVREVIPLLRLGFSLADKWVGAEAEEDNGGKLSLGRSTNLLRWKQGRRGTKNSIRPRHGMRWERERHDR